MNRLQISKWLRIPRAALPHPLTFLAAALLAPVAAPNNQSYLIWVFCIPWFEALKRSRGLGGAVVQGVWMSFFTTLGTFHWIAGALHGFGHLSWSITLPVFGFYALVAQPQFIAFAIVFKGIELRAPALLRNVFLLALFYTGLDFFSPKLFMDTLGHAFHLHRALRQCADLGGASLLTFLVVSVNAGIWHACAMLAGPRGALWRGIPRALLPPFGLLLALWGYGAYRLREIERRQLDAPRQLRIAMIQPNLSDMRARVKKLGFERASAQSLDTLVSLSRQALQASPRPDLLVWPETTYPSHFRSPNSDAEAENDRRLEKFVKETGVPLFFGGYDREEEKEFNALFFLEPPRDGEDLQYYHKSILVFFGEYIPGAERSRAIRNAFPRMANYSRGEGSKVIRWGKVQFAPLICYEALFPDYSIEGARKGADVIMNIADDSWFAPRGEPQLHLALSAYRSIETRLPQVRATNTGISALIRADGEVAQATDVGTQEIRIVDVALTDIWTLMKAWGDWFGRASFYLGWAWLGTVMLRERLTRSGARGPGGT